MTSSSGEQNGSAAANLLAGCESTCGRRNGTTGTKKVLKRHCRAKRSLYGFEGVNAPETRKQGLKDPGKEDIMSDRTGCPVQGNLKDNRIKFSVVITERPHLFPFRTQKLSSPVLTILGWRRPGKIGRCRNFISKGCFERNSPLSALLQLLPGE